jgi:hypothetical protein
MFHALFSSTDSHLVGRCNYLSYSAVNLSNEFCMSCE